jgi:membrane protein YqaA with SNARE-associated domain
MSVLRDCRDLVTRPGSQVHWVKLVIGFLGLIALSFLFAAFLSFMKSRLNINLFQFEVLAYISVFAICLLANMTLFAPVPFAVAVMVTAAANFNPLLVILSASIGGSLGEISGYYAGRWGRKIVIPESIIKTDKLEYWIKKYGFWAIAVLAFQPLIPFDLGGLVAGAARMPLKIFLPALWLGKFPKYVLLVYAALGIIKFLPPAPWIF